MSNPLDPNQQPISGAGHGVAGPYPGGQQFGAPYDPRSAQQTPATGGFSGYGQNQPGWAPQPQQGYYGVQGPALQGVGSYGSFGGQPQQSGPKKGLIIGIIGAVMAFILLIVLALALTQNGNRSSDRSASPTAPGGATPVPSATQPNPGSAQNPSSAPDKSQNSSNQVSSEEERNVVEQCRDALGQSISKGSIDEWTVDHDGTTEAGEPQFLMTGKLNGTLPSGRNGAFNFTCTAVYHPREKSYEAWASLDTK